MKRVSGGDQRARFVTYVNTVGIDVDSKYLVTAWYNHDTGLATTAEFEQSETGIRALVNECLNHHSEIVVLESTANYHMAAYDALISAKLNAIVINPIRIKALLRVEGKSDKADAITLARLAASFRLKASNMPDYVQREARTYWRVIDLAELKARQTRQRISAMLVAHGCTVTRVLTPSSRAYMALLEKISIGASPEEIASVHPMAKGRARLLDSNLELPEYVQLAIGSYIKELRLYTKQAHENDILLAKLMDQFNVETRLMCTVPGITPKLAWRIIAEMGVNFTDRYPSQRHFCKALGLVPSNIVSGGKLLKRESSHGNRRAKIHFLNNAKAYVVRPHNGGIYKWYLGYKERSGWMKAISALAHKMAEGAYITQKYGCPFDEEYYMGKRESPVDTRTGEIIDDDYVYEELE